MYVPATDELFTADARRRGAAERRADPLPADAPTCATALVATGFSYLPERRRGQAARLRRCSPQVRDLRRFGAAALDLCYVAAGRVDAYFEQCSAPWDLAAGELIAAEAGCRHGDRRRAGARPRACSSGTPGPVRRCSSLLDAPAVPDRRATTEAAHRTSTAGMLASCVPWEPASCPWKTTSASAPR